MSTRFARRYQASIPIEAIVETQCADGIQLVPRTLCSHEISTNGCVICTDPDDEIGRVRTVHIHVSAGKTIDIVVDARPVVSESRDVARLEWKALNPKDAALLVRYLERIPHGVPQGAKADFLENENGVMHSEIMNIESRRQRGFHLMFLLIAAYFAYLAAPYRVFSGHVLSSEQMLLFGLVGVWVSVMLCFHCVRFQDFLSRANRRISHLYRSIGANRGWVFAHDPHYFTRTVMPLGTQFDSWRARYVPIGVARAFASYWQEADRSHSPTAMQLAASAPTNGSHSQSDGAQTPANPVQPSGLWSKFVAALRAVVTRISNAKMIVRLRRSEFAAVVRLYRNSPKTGAVSRSSHDRREQFAEWLPYNNSTFWVLLFIQSFFVLGAFAFTSILTRTAEEAAAPPPVVSAANNTASSSSAPTLQTDQRTTAPQQVASSGGARNDAAAPAVNVAAAPLDLFDWRSFTTTFAGFGFFFLAWIHFACAAFFKHYKLTWEARRISAERPNPRFPDYAFARAFPRIDRIKWLGLIPIVLSLIALAFYLGALFDFGGGPSFASAPFDSGLFGWKSLVLVAAFYAVLKSTFLHIQFVVGDRIDEHNVRLRQMEKPPSASRTKDGGAVHEVLREELAAALGEPLSAERLPDTGDTSASQN